MWWTIYIKLNLILSVCHLLHRCAVCLIITDYCGAREGDPDGWLCNGFSPIFVLITQNQILLSFFFHNYHKLHTKYKYITNIKRIRKSWRKGPIRLEMDIHLKKKKCYTIHWYMWHRSNKPYFHLIKLLIIRWYQFIYRSFKSIYEMLFTFLHERGLPKIRRVYGYAIFLTGLLMFHLYFS